MTWMEIMRRSQRDGMSTVLGWATIHTLADPTAFVDEDRGRAAAEKSDGGAQVGGACSHVAQSRSLEVLSNSSAVPLAALSPRCCVLGPRR